MGRVSDPLPPGLGLLFSAQQARQSGVERRRLHASDVERLSTGTYRRRVSEGKQTHPNQIWRELQQAQAKLLAPRLAPGQFFAGPTAAALWQLPMPRTMMPMSHTEVDNRLTIGTLRHHRTSRRTEHRSVSIAASLATVTHLNGIPVTDPATTWAMVAPSLTRADAVALGDALLHDHRVPGSTRHKRPALAMFEELEAASRAPYRRGASELLTALPLLTSHSASPPESHMRLKFREWGFPDPSLDYDVYTPDGQLIGCSEFAWPEFRVAGEYEGGHHLTETAQWNRDIEKHHYYRVHGWEPVRATSTLLYRQPDELRRRFEQALRSRGWAGRGRDRDRDRA